MAETIDEISIEWKDENGQHLIKQVKKEVLTSGAWSTIMFMYQDLDKKTGQFGPRKIRVVRYQKRGGKFIAQSKFNKINGDGTNKNKWGRWFKCNLGIPRQFKRIIEIGCCIPIHQGSRDS